MNTMKLPLKNLGLLVFSAVAASGCANERGAAPTEVVAQTQPATPTGVIYQCDDGKRFMAEYDQTGQSATVTIAGKAIRLPQVSSASGVRYSDGNITLSTSGQEAMVEIGERQAFRNCTIKS